MARAAKVVMVTDDWQLVQRTVWDCHASISRVRV